MQGFGEKTRKRIETITLRRKSSLKIGRLFCAIWPESTGGRPVLVIKAAPSRPRPFYPQSLNCRAVTSRQNVPKQSVVPAHFCIGTLVVYPPSPPTIEHSREWAVKGA